MRAKMSPSGLLSILLLAVGIWAVIAGYPALDNAGWITHKHDTSVSSNDWWVGEHRTCSMITNLNVGKGLSAKYLDCPKASDVSAATGDIVGNPNILPGRVLPVEYHGRIDRSDTFIQWDCQRKEASLICKALN
jgi:hypothetical protein